MLVSLNKILEIKIKKPYYFVFTPKTTFCLSSLVLPKVIQKAYQFNIFIYLGSE